MAKMAENTNAEYLNQRDIARALNVREGLVHYHYRQGNLPDPVLLPGRRRAMWKREQLPEIAACFCGLGSWDNRYRKEGAPAGEFLTRAEIARKLGLAPMPVQRAWNEGRLCQPAHIAEDGRPFWRPEQLPDLARALGVDETTSQPGEYLCLTDIALAIGKSVSHLSNRYRQGRLPAPALKAHGDKPLWKREQLPEIAACFAIQEKTPWVEPEPASKKKRAKKEKPPAWVRPNGYLNREDIANALGLSNEAVRDAIQKKRMPKPDLLSPKGMQLWRKELLPEIAAAFPRKQAQNSQEGLVSKRFIARKLGVGEKLFTCLWSNREQRLPPPDFTDAKGKQFWTHENARGIIRILSGM